jgi:hypothetical protein
LASSGSKFADDTRLARQANEETLMMNTATFSTTTATRNKVNEAMLPSDGLKTSIGVINKDVWFRLSAFVDVAIYNNPTDDEKMRTALGIKAKDTYEADFTVLAKHYATLKTQCEGFKAAEKETIALADDIVHYESNNRAIWGHMIDMFAAYDAGNQATVKEKLAALEAEWAKPNPSEQAQDILSKFKRFVGRLQDEAAERADKAKGLLAKYNEFHTGLEVSQNNFKDVATRLHDKYNSNNPKVEQMKKDLKDLQGDIERMLKKEKDEIIVLGTSPLYLLIPFIGPLILAGVNIGVGVDLGLLRVKIKEAQDKAQLLTHELDVKERFVSHLETGETMANDTVKSIEKIITDLDVLEKAWRAISSDLGNLKDNVGKAVTDVSKKDWLFAPLDLETVKNQWRDVAQLADNYRRFAKIDAAKSVDDIVNAPN